VLWWQITILPPYLVEILEAKMKNIEKIREKLSELGKIVAFLQTDDETYEVGEDIEKIWIEALTLLSKPCQAPHPDITKTQAKQIKQLETENEELIEEKEELLQLTEMLDEHPEGYDGPCFCKLCMSYG